MRATSTTMRTISPHGVVDDVVADVGGRWWWSSARGRGGGPLRWVVEVVGGTVVVVVGGTVVVVVGGSVVVVGGARVLGRHRAHR